MRLVDVNVLVYAHRLDTPRHEDYAAWLHALLAGQEPYGISDLVLSGFLRVVTNPKVFKQPTPIETALGFTAVIRTQPNSVPVEPGRRAGHGARRRSPRVVACRGGARRRGR